MWLTSCFLDFKELRKGRKTRQKDEHDKTQARGEASHSKTHEDRNAPTTTAAEVQPTITASTSVGDETSPQPREVSPLADQQSDPMPAGVGHNAPYDVWTSPMEYEHQYAYGGYAYTPQHGWVYPQEVVNQQQFGFGGCSTFPLSSWHPQQLNSGQQSAPDAQRSGTTGANGAGKKSDQDKERFEHMLISMAEFFNDSDGTSERGSIT